MVKRLYREKIYTKMRHTQNGNIYKWDIYSKEFKTTTT